MLRLSYNNKGATKQINVFLITTNDGSEGYRAPVTLKERENMFFSRQTLMRTVGSFFFYIFQIPRAPQSGIPLPPPDGDQKTNLISVPRWFQIEIPPLCFYKIKQRQVSDLWLVEASLMSLPAFRHFDHGGRGERRERLYRS